MSTFWSTVDRQSLQRKQTEKPRWEQAYVVMYQAVRFSSHHREGSKIGLIIPMALQREPAPQLSRPYSHRLRTKETESHHQRVIFRSMLPPIKGWLSRKNMTRRVNTNCAILYSFFVKWFLVHVLSIFYF